jgi:phospholipase C
VADCEGQPEGLGESGEPRVEHVFVLMLENRSFDHFLAYSAIAGISTTAPGSSNDFGGATYPVGDPGAPWTLPTDPGHEFGDAFVQLFGEGAIHQPWAPYPTPIGGPGFVASYATSRTEEAPANPTPARSDAYRDVMRCFDTAAQLPVLHQLASEFAVCDHWFSSVPGPTWPNRLFVHGASAGGWTNSPTPDQLRSWYETSAKFTFPSGASIFDRLRAAGRNWRVYADEVGPALGGVPMVAALKGVTYQRDTFPLSQFDADLAGGFDYAYTFIEPNYGDVMSGSFKGGSSQHPTDGTYRGEALIKSVYESVRRSPVWDRSLLVIVWDEHGGFFDSIPPGPAHPPHDGSPQDPAINTGGFLFDWYGVRVPAVVVSPWIARRTVDHTVYDHASVPATLERLFGLDAMTERDLNANDLLSLLVLDEARSDCPLTLSEPVTAPNETASVPSAQPAPSKRWSPAAIRLAIVAADRGGVTPPALG